jgi:hypothetical protein
MAPYSSRRESGSLKRKENRLSLYRVLMTIFYPLRDTITGISDFFNNLHGHMKEPPVPPIVRNFDTWYNKDMITAREKPAEIPRNSVVSAVYYLEFTRKTANSAGSGPVFVQIHGFGE